MKGSKRLPDMNELNPVSWKLHGLFFMAGSRLGNSSVLLDTIRSITKAFDLEDFPSVICISFPVLSVYD